MNFDGKRQKPSKSIRDNNGDCKMKIVTHMQIIKGKARERPERKREEQISSSCEICPMLCSRVAFQMFQEMRALYDEMEEAGETDDDDSED